MAVSDAQSALDRIEADESFAARLRETAEQDGQEATLALVRAEGFDVTPDEMRDAFLDRYGDELTQEQLDAIAGGVDWMDATAVAAFGIGIFGSVIAMAAVAATA